MSTSRASGSTRITTRSPTPCLHADLAAALGAAGRWLVVAPHDDDLVLGMGLAVQCAHAAGIEVHVAVVSDGRMGYADPAQRHGIAARRRAEMEASCTLLGIPAGRTHWLGFPDGDLPAWQGCRDGDDGLPTGIARALTGVLRALAPSLVFGPTPADLHPDHRVVASELDIACFHASGDIWRELGAPVALPRRFDYAVYCPFPHLPEVEIHAAPDLQARKLEAIAAFASQAQIGALVERLRAAPPLEYLQEVTWRPYRPADFQSLFGIAAGDGRPGEGGFERDCRRTLEMLDRWPDAPWDDLVTALAERQRRPLLLVGEGSSRLFPAAWARSLARRFGLIGIEEAGGREAAALDPARWRLVALSNSGETREVIEAVQAHGGGGSLAVLGRGDGRLAGLVPRRRVVLDRPEEAVAATVSVAGQALVLAEAVAAAAGRAVPRAELRAAIAALLAQDVPAAALAALPGARRLLWSGGGDGCAGELALKTCEVAGLTGIHLPANLLLHGIEEVLGPGDLVIALDPPAADGEAIRRHLVAGTGARVLGIGSGPVDWPLPDLGPWSPLVHLVAGWRLLGALAGLLGRDPDRPRRARKVGNPQPDAAP